MKKSKKEEIKEKKQNLWDTMLELRKCIDEEEDEINEAVVELYQNQPPLWLTDSITFGSLIFFKEQEIYDTLDTIEQQQKLLKIRLNGTREQERRKQALLDDISRLQSMTTATTESDASSITDTNIDLQIQEYDRSCRNERNHLHNLEEEEEELEAELEKCDQELERARNEREMFNSQLLESSNIIKQFRKKNNEIQKFIKSIVQHRNALHKRQKDLTLLGDSLLRARAENEKMIRRLEDKYGKHQQLVSDLDEIEEKIKAKERKQEMTLTKMIEAVRTAEQNKVEVMKQSAINQKLTNEVNRINELTRNSSKKLTEALEDHQSTIVKQFENILNQLIDAVKETEAQNKEIVQDRSVVQRRVDLAIAENNRLLQEKGDNGFEDFLSSVTKIQNDICDTISQINQLKVTNDRIADTISMTKTRILCSGKDCRDELAILKQKEENIQSEIEETAAQCAEMIEHNEKLTGENKELRIAIIAAKRDAEKELEERMEEKKHEIEEMERDIKVAQEESRRAVENITQASQGYKKHADKWRCQLEIIGAEASDCKSTITNSHRSKRDEAKQMQMRIMQTRQAMEEMQCKINELDKELIIVRSELAERNGRIRKFRRRIKISEEDGIEYGSSKDEMMRMSKQLDAKISKLGAELYVLKAQTN